jgi:hypothetical protein
VLHEEVPHVPQGQEDEEPQMPVEYAPPHKGGDDHRGDEELWLVAGEQLLLAIGAHEAGQVVAHGEKGQDEPGDAHRVEIVRRRQERAQAQQGSADEEERVIARIDDPGLCGCGGHKSPGSLCQLARCPFWTLLIKGGYKKTFLSL